MPGATAARRLECQKIIYLIDKNVSIAILLQTRFVSRIGATDIVAELQNSRKTAGQLAVFCSTNRRRSS
jgi:hypothetical protein